MKYLKEKKINREDPWNILQCIKIEDLQKKTDETCADKKPRIISIIITVRITSTLFEAGKRLKRLCARIPLDLFEIVVVDYGTASEQSTVLKELPAQGVRVLHHPAPQPVFSIGAARDYGAQAATGDLLFFLDIDFDAPPEIFRRIHALACAKSLFLNSENFLCIPVMFLTEKGTHAFVKNSEFLNKYSYAELEGNAEILAFPSYGSSAIVVNRRHYMAIGGHDSSFKGHGAEDFELLHRLSSLAPWGRRSDDYYKDSRVKTFEPLRGFRPYFARYALPALREGIFLVHHYHPKRTERGYFRRRRNFFLLALLMRRFDKHEIHPLPLNDLHSKKRLLVCVKRNDPDFHKFRPWMVDSEFYQIFDESALLAENAVEKVVKNLGINGVLMRSPIYSPQKKKMLKIVDEMGLETIFV